MNAAEELEAQSAEKPNWSRVEEIPGFPLKNYMEVKKKVSSKEFTLGIDFTGSNKFAEFHCGKWHKIYLILFAIIPVFIAIASVILAISYRNGWILFCIPVGLIGQIPSNPYDHIKKHFTFIALISLPVLLFVLTTNSVVIHYGVLFLLMAFLGNRFIYSIKQNKLKSLAMNSEKIFIGLYQDEKIGLMDNSNGRSYWISNNIL